VLLDGNDQVRPHGVDLVALQHSAGGLDIACRIDDDEGGVRCVYEGTVPTKSGSIRPTGPVDPTNQLEGFCRRSPLLGCTLRMAESRGRRRTYDLLPDICVDDGGPLSGAQKLRNQETAIGALSATPTAKPENGRGRCCKMVAAVCRHTSGSKRSQIVGRPY
jgi:hypothetical protein